MSASLSRVLGDLVVVELAEDVAGCYCGKVLADLGAAVMKVEPPEGDVLRRRSAERAAVDGATRTGTWLHLNTNKQSCVVDPAAPDATARLRELVDAADLVITSSGRGSLARWGLAWDSLHATRPAVSVVVISGFGATGPYSEFRWDDLTVQAFSGTLWAQEDPGLPPVKLPAHAAMSFVGSVAALGGLAAVMTARREGAGAFIDCAAIEALASMPSKAFGLLRNEYLGADAGGSGGPVGPTLLPNGVFPCADGYVVSSSSAPYLAALLDVLDDDDLRAAFAQPGAFDRGSTKEIVDAALYPWLLSHDRATLTATAQARGWILAGVNGPDDVLEAGHLRQRGFWVHTDDPVTGPVDLPGHPVRFAEGGWALQRLAPELGEADRAADRALPSIAVGDPAPRRSRASASGLPLDGIRVLDMTAVWSGPYATALLADLGAEVIRIENPWVFPAVTKGYEPRPTVKNPGQVGSSYAPPRDGRPDRPYNRSAANNAVTRNKRSLAVDTRRPEGRNLVLRLVEQSDVFVENLRPFALERMGLHADAMRARNPRMVVLRLPACGTSGDWAAYAAYGPQVSGLSGLTWLHGDPGTDAYTSPMTTYMDAATGPAAAFAVLAALHYRDAVGRGQVVELAQIENLIHHFGHAFVEYELGSKLERLGNRDVWRAPSGLYPCRGGALLAIAVADDDEWRALSGAVAPELSADTRFADVAGRRLHHDEIDEVLSRWTSTRDVLDAFHALQRAGVTAAPVLDEPTFAADLHVRARGWLQPLESLDAGVHVHAGPPYQGLPHRWWRGAPVLGEDNAYVCKDVVGISDDEYQRLCSEQILAEDYLDASGRPY